jgi:hypothetical protein
VCPSDGELKIGRTNNVITPVRDYDYGCTSTTSVITSASGATYWAAVTAFSHFPCAEAAVSLCGRASATDRTGGPKNMRDSQAALWPQAGKRPTCGPAAVSHQQPTFAVHCQTTQQIITILTRGFTFACSGPFAGTCSKLTSMTGASAMVVSVDTSTIWASSECNKCIGQLGGASAACYPRGNTWKS